MYNSSGGMIQLDKTFSLRLPLIAFHLTVYNNQTVVGTYNQ